MSRRGLSFLRVSTEQESPAKGDPNSSSASTSSLTAAVPATSSVSTGSPNDRPDSSASVRSSALSSQAAAQPGGRQPGIRSRPGSERNEVEDPVAAYLAQLAAKQARVVELREELARIKAELSNAETELNYFQRNGSKNLASLVGSPPTSSPRPPSDHTVLDSPGAQQDVLDMGRRVVDGIGSQFWSFVEEVKKTTMGEVERDPEYPEREGRVYTRTGVGGLVDTVRRNSPLRSGRIGRASNLSPSRSPGRTLEGSPFRSPSRSPNRSARRSSRSPDRLAVKGRVDRNTRPPAAGLNKLQLSDAPPLPQRPSTPQGSPSAKDTPNDLYLETLAPPF